MSSLWQNRDRAEINDDSTIDEVVIDGWLHAEEMDRHGGTGRRFWWVRLGDAEFDVVSTRNGYEVYQRQEERRNGCDCSRCQTEGCVANTYCPCCLRSERDAAKAERDVLRKTINETEIALHKPWKYDCECCLRIGEELGAWGGTPAWETRALGGDGDE